MAHCRQTSDALQLNLAVLPVLTLTCSCPGMQALWQGLQAAPATAQVHSARVPMWARFPPCC